MLRVVIYGEVARAPEVYDFVNQVALNSGGELIGVLDEKSLTLFNDLYAFDPDVLIVPPEDPIDILWALLLRVKSIRLQGKEWPMIILATYGSTRGVFIPELDVIDETVGFYFTMEPPYFDLYDVCLDHFETELGASLATIGLKHYENKLGKNKNWTLRDDATDYGLLTYKHLDCSLPLAPPAIVCRFEPTAAYKNIRSAIEHAQGLDQERGGILPRYYASPLNTELGLQLVSAGETLALDKFLNTSDDFAVTIFDEEATFRISDDAIYRWKKRFDNNEVG